MATISVRYIVHADVDAAIAFYTEPSGASASSLTPPPVSRSSREATCASC